jgi:hypothetical protein
MVQYDLTQFLDRPICAILIGLSVMSLGLSMYRATVREFAGTRR